MEGEDLTRYEYDSDYSDDDMSPEEFVALLPTPEDFEEYMRHDWDRLIAEGNALKAYVILAYRKGYDQIRKVDGVLIAPTTNHAKVAARYPLMLKDPVGYFENNSYYHRTRERAKARAPITPPELARILRENFKDDYAVGIDEFEYPRYPPWIRPQRRKR